MRRIELFRLTGAVAAALVLGAFSAPSAGARATLTPASNNFGSLPLGATSGPMSYTLTVTCNAEMPGCPPDPFHPDPVVGANTPDWAVTHNCPDGMPGADATGTSCTINVTFSPIATGPRGATLDSGIYLTPNPEPAPPGPTAQAFGYGICSSCFAGSSTGAQPPYTIPGPGFNLAGDVTDSKKCKKKKGKAKKKCKKKRK
jgi:hypothetical protein